MNMLPLFIVHGDIANMRTTTRKKTQLLAVLMLAKVYPKGTQEQGV